MNLHPLNTIHGASLVAQMVKNPPAMWDTWVQSLGWEDPLEEGMATHSNILAWRIPRTEEPGGLWSMVHGVATSWTRLKRLSTCQYRMQIPSILHLPIKHLRSSVLSHRTLGVRDTELSSVLSPLSPVWTSQTRFWFGLWQIWSSENEIFN